MSEKKPQEKALTYKNRPLTRCGDELYYGSMDDKYIIMMKVLDSTPLKDTKVSGKVLVQLMYTDPEISLKDRVVKKSEKQGLYNALDIGAIWLERALAGK